MLPPPTTTAISTSSSWCASASSMAMRSTMALSMVSSEAELANASPDSFRTTLRQRSVVTSSADDDLGEAHDVGLAEHLPHALLVVLGEGLLEQHPLLEPAVQHAVDDLGQGRLGLAGVARLGLEGRPLGLDLVGGHVLAPQVLRLAEGDVHGDVVGELLGATVQLHEHPVDTPVVLHVQVGVDDVAVL